MTQTTGTSKDAQTALPSDLGVVLFTLAFFESGHGQLLGLKWMGCRRRERYTTRVGSGSSDTLQLKLAALF